MANTIDDVLRQMAERGIEPPPDIAPDGKKRTWAGDARKPKKRNAWGVFYEWTSPKTGKVYVVGRYGIRDEHWAVEPTQTEWSPAEKTAWLERKKALEREADAARTELADTARAKAQRFWARARLDGASAYLQRKQVGAYGVRYMFGAVVVPLWDVAGTLHGLQWIQPDGQKTFGTGTVKEGHFCLLGDVADGLPIAFAEGYATAASVHMATGWPVVAAFDAGNLLPVVAAWRKLYPDADFVLAADDDRYLMQRLCARLADVGVAVRPGDLAKDAGGIKQRTWPLPDGGSVQLAAQWVRDKSDVWGIEGSITAQGSTRMLRLENAGRAKAYSVARKYNCRVLLPQFADVAAGAEAQPTDWNDLHVLAGLDVVRAQLLAPPKAQHTGGAAERAGAQPGDGGADAADAGSTPRRLFFPFVTDRHEPRGIRENVSFALLEDPALQGLVRYNEFAQTIDRVRPAPWAHVPGPWREMDDLRLAAYLAHQHALLVANPITISQAVMMAAQDAAYNPVADAFNAHVWDGVPRLRYWLAECMGAAEGEFSALVGMYFLISMVARVMEPGCQMDYMLVLQGPQGQGKSSVLQVLAGEQYGAGSFRVGEKDSLQALQGRLLFNFNELDALNKAEATAIKGYITERIDRFRPPYGKAFEAFPRCCVLTGDTNQGEFLRDATGDRRFWVVHCGAVDVAKMREWRDQLIAEAVHEYRQGTRRYPTPEEERALFFPEQDRWKFVDVWTDRLAQYVNSTELVEGVDGCTNDTGVVMPNLERRFFSTLELLTRALHIDIGKVDRAGSMQKSVGNAMRVLGFEPHKWSKGRARPRGYIRASTPMQTPAAGPSGAPAGPLHASPPPPSPAVPAAQPVVNPVPEWE